VAFPVSGSSTGGFFIPEALLLFILVFSSTDLPYPGQWHDQVRPIGAALVKDIYALLSFHLYLQTPLTPPLMITPRSVDVSMFTASLRPKGFTFPQFSLSPFLVNSVVQVTGPLQGFTTLTSLLPGTPCTRFQNVRPRIFDDEFLFIPVAFHASLRVI